MDNISFKIGGEIIKISCVKHYDPSASLFLGMPFINSVLPFTITHDRVICTIKKKAVAVNRLTLADSEVKSNKVQKKAAMKNPAKDSDDWVEVLKIYEDRITQKTAKHKACITEEWNEEQK